MDFLFILCLFSVWIFFAITFAGINAGMEDHLAPLLGLLLAVGFGTSYTLAHFFSSLPVLYLAPILLVAPVCFYLAFRGGRRSSSITS